MTVRETIVLEPRSRIASFDTIGYRTVQAVNGAIAGTLFGKDREKKSAFFKSNASRKNKQILSQLTSEIYSYLNGVISEFADPEDYFFRLWVRVEIDKKTGEIIGHPLFDSDMFKYIGKVGGKYVEVGDYALKVFFIGKVGTHISPIFIKGIKKVASDTKLIRFRPYESYSISPDEIKQKITSDSPYLVIDDKPIEIKLRLDEKTTTIIPFMEKNGRSFDFIDQSSIENFILREIALKPEIIKSGTFFQYSDAELKQIKEKIDQHAKDVEEPTLLETLNIEQILKDIKDELDIVNTEKLSEKIEIEYNKHIKLFKRLDDKYFKLSREWDVQRQDILDTKKDLEKGLIGYEEFSTLRVRRSMALRKISQELINFQENLKKKIVPDFNRFISSLKKAEK